MFSPLLTSILNTSPLILYTSATLSIFQFLEPAILSPSGLDICQVHSDIVTLCFSLSPLSSSGLSWKAFTDKRAGLGAKYPSSVFPQYFTSPVSIMFLSGYIGRNKICCSWLSSKGPYFTRFRWVNESTGACSVQGELKVWVPRNYLLCGIKQLS